MSSCENCRVMSTGAAPPCRWMGTNEFALKRVDVPGVASLKVSAWGYAYAAVHNTCSGRVFTSRIGQSGWAAVYPTHTCACTRPLPHANLVVEGHRLGAVRQHPRPHLLRTVAAASHERTMEAYHGEGRKEHVYKSPGMGL